MKITIEISSIDELMRLKQWLNTVNCTDVSQPIAMLGLTTRANNCLLAEEINTLGDLLEWTDIDLLKTPNIGMKLLKEIKDALHLRGLDLKNSTAG